MEHQDSIYYNANQQQQSTRTTITAAVTTTTTTKETGANDGVVVVDDDDNVLAANKVDDNNDDDDVEALTNNKTKDDDDDDNTNGEGASSSGLVVVAATAPPVSTTPVVVGNNNSHNNHHNNHNSIRDIPVLSTFHDHFTMSVPSSTIRYREKHSAARILETEAGKQFVLEETYVTHDNNNNNNNNTNDISQRSSSSRGNNNIIDGYHRNISIRVITDSSTGVLFLRLVYVIFTAFFTGFLFVFCLQILLFLVLDLAIELGQTKQQEQDIGSSIGVLLAFPVLVYGLSSMLVIAGAFINDTWTGHSLVRNFTFRKTPTSIAEWIFFMFFLGIPLFVMSISLVVNATNWWEITTLTWFVCITIFYILFAVNVIFYEMRACWEVTKNRYDTDDDSWYMLIKRSILLRQVQMYSGRKRNIYMSRGTIKDSEYTDNTNSNRDIVENTLRTRIRFSGYVTRFIAIQLSFLGLYDILEHEEPTYTVDDARDVRPFITKHTWSLEKIFCRPVDSRFIAIINGPGAITRDQAQSSTICSIVGTLLILFIFFSFLLYMKLGIGFAFLCVVIVIIMSWSNFMSAIRVYQASKDISWNASEVNIIKRRTRRRRRRSSNNNDFNDDNDMDDNTKNNNDNNATTERQPSITSSTIPAQQQQQPAQQQLAQQQQQPQSHVVVDNEAQSSSSSSPGSSFVISEAVYLVQENCRITKPTRRMCWIMFVIEIIFLFLWPLSSLYSIGNNRLATLFTFIALISALRHYINAGVVLEETGHMNLVDGNTPDELWNNQSRLNRIVGDITRGRSRSAWISVLGLLGFAFLALMFFAVGTSTTEHNSTSVDDSEAFDTPFTYMNDYYYEQTDTLRYTTCDITNNVGSPLTSMADFAYLAGLAYRGDTAVTQRELDGWFGGNSNLTVLDQESIVKEWKEINNVKSEVSFKLVTLPEKNNHAYVLVRGTTTPMDMLTDAQLWSAAFLMQGLRELLPLGYMFSPIMDTLIYAMTKLESESINRVSFYRDTSKFINDIRKETTNDGITPLYGGIGITGHSLGGGLAMISGAQTKIPAVALSGPNAMLSRKTFNTPIEQNELDTWTFNIIPSRDIVPKIDDPAQNYQIIRCQAPFEDLLGCHDSTRSLCEIISSCGSGNRPVLCECIDEGYDFIEPIPKEYVIDKSISFREACQIARNETGILSSNRKK